VVSTSRNANVRAAAPDLVHDSVCSPVDSLQGGHFTLNYDFSSHSHPINVRSMFAMLIAGYPYPGPGGVFSWMVWSLNLDSSSGIWVPGSPLEWWFFHVQAPHHPKKYPPGGRGIQRLMCQPERGLGLLHHLAKCLPRAPVAHRQHTGVVPRADS
jgi:hypothetical protein